MDRDEIELASDEALLDYIRRIDMLENGADELLDEESYSPFTRTEGEDASPMDVRWEYFLFLCAEVGLNGADRRSCVDIFDADYTFFRLGLRLFNTKYMPLLEDDRNRIADGIALRERFMWYSTRYKDYSSIDVPGINLLEFFISFAQRIDRDLLQSIYDDENRSGAMFWTMMENLGFSDFSDSRWTEEADLYIKDALKRWQNRMFSADGKGGIFPLKSPKKDQKMVNFWYQMQAYIMENRM